MSTRSLGSAFAFHTSKLHRTSASSIRHRNFSSVLLHQRASILRIPETTRKNAILSSQRSNTALFVATEPSVEKQKDNNNANLKVINLSTVEKSELETLIVDAWGFPKYRVDQVWNWIRVQGVTNVDDMLNIPKKLRHLLSDYAKPSSLELAFELKSNDGTIKRAYKCYDGQVIESVLMPYESGRYTACISSQAGCAQGCVFCATGQMGFSRQLTSDEIFEQVARFAAELKQEDKQDNKDKKKSSNNKSHRAKRLSNIVFMGMGEPLANYRNVVQAVNRITSDLGIGARKITISTVGIVPNIRKLTDDPNMPQVRLAVSLHCATDEERNELLPANRRNGGLENLMDSLSEYIQRTGRRITLEWALIEGENDTPEVARKLGRLLTKGGPEGKFKRLRRDMVHVNVIPLNPTSQFSGGPSQRHRVNAFIDTLEKEYGIACTPRVRRGIDINAGCGQLKADVLEKEKRQGVSANEEEEQPSLSDFMENNESSTATVGVYEDEDEWEDESYDYDAFEVKPTKSKDDYQQHPLSSMYSFEDSVDFDNDDFEDPEYSDDWDRKEAERLLDLVKGTTINSSLLEDKPKKKL